MKFSEYEYTKEVFGSDFKKNASEMTTFSESEKDDQLRTIPGRALGCWRGIGSSGGVSLHVK